MIAVIQRVSHASVSVEGREVSRIGQGILTLLGVQTGDTGAQLRKIVEKIVNLRIFEDASGKMNRSLLDIQGEHLIVSQFTLAADCSAGRRPSFISAEKPELARALYNDAIETSSKLGVTTRGGVFQAEMKIELVNLGPATFILNS